jgi:hypothetical protein
LISLHHPKIKLLQYGTSHKAQHLKRRPEVAKVWMLFFFFQELANGQCFFETAKCEHLKPTELTLACTFSNSLLLYAGSVVQVYPNIQKFHCSTFFISNHFVILFLFA